MPGLSKVIVLDPDARAARQVQLGFEREGIPAAAVATEPLELPGEDTGLVVVGGSDREGVELVRRARGWLDDHGVDAPIVFAGRGVLWSDATTAGADEVVRHPAYLRDVVTIGRLLRGVPAGRRDHIVGNLIEVTGVLTLVRALAALGRSATLTLVRGLRRGEVRFYHGEVTSAQVGMIHGQAALHQLLLWTDARFDFRHQDVVRRQQIPLAPDELFADAERFLEGVRESSGGLSPAMVLEQDVPRLQSLARQIPTEVYGVLRMFDGHRAIADVLEDSAYRVFETLRVAQRAVEAGLLRAVETQPPRPSWRAFLAIEDWLVGSEPRDAAGDSGPVASSRDAMAVTVRDARGAPPAAAVGAAGAAMGPAAGAGKSGRKRKKRKPRTDTPRAIAIGAVAPREIDWGLLVPRIVGAEVGPLAGVVPASQVAGEIVTTAAMRVGAPAGKAGGAAGEPSVVFDEAAEVAREAAARRAEIEAHSEVERIAAGARAAAEAELAAEPQHARERALAAAQAERTAAEARAVADAERAGNELAAAERATAEADAAEAAEAERAAASAAEAHAAAIRAVAATMSVSSEPARLVADTRSVSSEPARVVADMDLVETKRERGIAPGVPGSAAAAPAAPEPAFLTQPGVAEDDGDGAGPANDAITSPVAAVAALAADRAAFVPPGAITEPLAAFVPPGAITEPLAAFVPPGAITEPLAATAAPAADPPDVAPAAPAADPTVAAPGAPAADPADVAPAAPAADPADVVPGAVTEPLAAVVPPGAIAEPAALVTAPDAELADPAPDAIAAPLAAVTFSGAITAPLAAVVVPEAQLAEVAARAERSALVDDAAAAEPAPTEVVDEPSDGVVRHHIATAETAPVRRRPPAERVDDDRPGDATGEITMPRQRPAIEVRHSEPSILIADLAIAHAAVSGVLDKQACAATPDAASPAQEAPVAEIRGDAAELHGDAAEFSDAEEAFFNAGHSRDEPPAAPTSESFDDLDEGYRRVGFWERLRGKLPKGPGP